MTEEARPDLDLAQMEQQDAEVHACQPQNPYEIATWKSILDWAVDAGEGGAAPRR